ncbi:MAG: amidohydrolase family protein [Alphaproteobacteria bacterium]|nr:amidohydrolase family protein [Alphaproteobacteria bacterium]
MVETVPQPTEHAEQRDPHPLQGTGWDCHIHVFGDPETFPFSPDRRYTPEMAGPDAAVAFLDGLGARTAVLQQASVYGEDDGCLLWALERLAGRAVGVVQMPQRAPRPDDLEQLHARGVRGIRLHLADHDPVAAAQAANRYADLGWHLDVHSLGAGVDQLQSLIDCVRPPMVLDHFAGLAPRPDGSIEPCLARWLDTGRVWLKVSAPYRVAGLTHDRVTDYVAALVTRWPERCLWGSDWPHTPVHPVGQTERLTPRPFRSVDAAAEARAALGKLTSGQRDAVLRTTPAKLYSDGLT